MEQKHSQLPWKAIESGVITNNWFVEEDTSNRIICNLSMYANGEANAQFIVQACNNFESLRQACLDVKLSLGLISASPDVVDTLLHTVLGLNIQKLEAAIAKAEASHGN